MKTKVLSILSIMVLAGSAAVYTAPTGKDTIRRFTLVVGSNYGGKGRERLRYAVSDARSMVQVLGKMGGVNDSDSMLLVEPDRNEFMKALAGMKSNISRARSSTRRLEIIFYYSGHSDQEGILLGNQKVDYRTIRRGIENMPADVRIAILDSCSSGAFTRLKGGTMQAPFMVDSSYNMKGYAFLTSSSSNEASQESDLIKGSFFTHFLVTGLRGAADMNDDGRITLNEVYQFAYSETLSRTEKTYGGPQHPNYNIQMKGTGDVIITDIRRGKSGLVLPSFLYGRVSVRDEDGNLVAEITKQAGRDLTLMVGRGTYTVLNQRDGQVFETSVSVKDQGRYAVKLDSLTPTDREYAMLRGGTQYLRVPLDFSLVPMQKHKQKTIYNYSFNFLGSYCSRLDGMSVGLGVAVVEEDAGWLMANLISNYVDGSMSGGQISYVMNYAGGDSEYAQITTVVNYTGRSARYLQMSNVVNYTGRDFSGMQATGIVNIVKDNMNGLQFSAIANYTGDDVKGLQFSLVNIGGNTTGAQVGLVNVADDVKGVQFGLVNVADEMTGVPIGLVNIADNGGLEVSTWGSNLVASSIGLRIHAGYVYTMFSAGTGNLEGSMKAGESVATGFHMGARIPFWKCYLDMDGGAITLDNENLSSYDEGEDQLALQWRAALGFRIVAGFSVFAGGGSSYLAEAGKPFEDGRWKPLLFGGVSVGF